MLLIVTPLKFEFDLLTRALEDEGFFFEKVESEEENTLLKTQKFYLSFVGQGKVKSALGLQHLIQKYTPSRVLAIGSAGVLNKNLKLGECYAVETVTEHDYKVKFIKKALPKFLCDKDSWGYKRVHIASGDEDVLTKQEALRVQALTGADLVCWESAGMIRAAQFCKVPYSEIRVATDLCEGLNKAEFKENLTKGFKDIAKTVVLRSI